jgi:hypothetical protein
MIEDELGEAAPVVIAGTKEEHDAGFGHAVFLAYSPAGVECCPTDVDSH